MADRGIEIPGPRITRQTKREVGRQYKKLCKLIDRDGDQPMVTLKHIFTFVDIHNKLIHSKDAVCKPGCCHCCRLAVEITAAEAVYIGELVGVKPVEYPEKKYNMDDCTPCPFLKKDTCSVYDRRPMACRNFFTYDDPKFCWPLGQQHKIVSLENGWGSKVLMGLLASMLEASQGVVADIRDFFPKEM
jgi:Fe-S-cluster containining protein